MWPWDRLTGSSSSLTTVYVHSLSTYCAPGTVLGSGDSGLNQTDKIPALREFSVLWGRQSVKRKWNEIIADCSKRMK